MISFISILFAKFLDEAEICTIYGPDSYFLMLLITGFDLQCQITL